MEILKRKSVVSSAFLSVAAVVSTLTSGKLTYALAAGGFTLLGNLLVLERRDRSTLVRQRHSLDFACKSAIEDLRKTDPTARLNIMMIRRKPICKSFVFFHSYWLDPEHDDANLTLGLTQGVAGVAYKYGRLAWGNLNTDECFIMKNGTPERIAEKPCQNMDQKQRDCVANLKLIYSVPIRALENHGEAGSMVPKGDVIGVLNIDSRNSEAFSFYKQNGLHDELIKKKTGSLARLSRVAAYFLHS